MSADTPLSGADIKTFEARGFFRLEGALQRSTCEEWAARVEARLATEPARWVRGYEEIATKRGPLAFDPADSATWTWPKFSIRGGDRTPIAVDAPAVWAAIGQLVGGHERLKTHEWNDYTVADYGIRGWRGHLIPRRPGGWHIDSPKTDTRLTNIDLGVLLFVFLTDVGPRGGAPWIAPDSIPNIARELKRTEAAGVDFTGYDIGKRLAKASTELIEVRARAGDVILCHPLMLHAACPNRSRHRRLMMNPNVYMSRPHRFAERPADASPIERAVHAALS